MFTGIVRGWCEVVSIAQASGVARLTIDLGTLADDLETGASVSNNGVCLTVTEIAGSHVGFDVIGESLGLTNLGRLEAGDHVNIERSLKFGDELGGHVLSGHVAGMATVVEIVADGANRTMWFEVDPEHLRFLLLKGWVALNGASLTISRVDRENRRIGVSLIPETLERTTLGRVVVGGVVNLEIDAQTQAIVETVKNMLADPDLRAQILSDTVMP